MINLYMYMYTRFCCENCRAPFLFSAGVGKAKGDGKDIDVTYRKASLPIGGKAFLGPVRKVSFLLA